MGEIKYIIEEIQNGVKISNVEKKLTLKIFKDGTWIFETPQTPKIQRLQNKNDIFSFITSVFPCVPKE